MMKLEAKNKKLSATDPENLTTGGKNGIL